MSPAIPPVHREVRDGVPIYWTPEATHFTGALVFRVGWADETVLTHGTTHLVEHLALYGFGAKQAFSLNGRVDGISTMFVATGTPDEVTSFLNGVCRTLSALPLHRLVPECRVLQAEFAQRTGGVLDPILYLRYGARGHGLSYLPEYALLSPDPDRVRSWALERFTAENAAAWFSGPVPSGIEFGTLPHGRRIPCLPCRTLDDIHPPCFLDGPSGGVAVSFVSKRDAWINAVMEPALARMRERLRFDKAIAYGIDHGYQLLESHAAHSVIGARCLDEHVVAIQEDLVHVLQEIAENGLTPEELVELRATMVRRVENPDFIPQHLHPPALNELVGYPVKMWTELLDLLDRMTPETSANTVRDALETAMLLRPQGCAGPPPPFSCQSYDSGVAVTGRRFTHASQKFPWGKKSTELVVGSEGVGVRFSDGHAIVVPFARCEGAVLYPDGVLYLVSDDGWQITLNPAEWKAGERARDAALDAIPGDRLLVVPRT